MRLNEMIGVLLYFDSVNGLRRIASSDSVVTLLAEYRAGWKEGFELTVLFDSRHYASQLPASEFDDVSPLEHYLQDPESKANPHPLFDAHFYRSRYGRLCWGSPAIVDYATTHTKGERGSRTSSPFFDPGYYLSRNPDVAATKVDPLVHFLRFGATEARAFHPFLDLSFVRAQLVDDSPEVGGMDDLELLKYVIAFNVLDRVEPSGLFSNRIYRQSKVGRIDRCPFYDFMTQTDPYLSGDPAGTFSVRKYVGENPSVNFHFTNAYAHYLTYGSKWAETCDLVNWSAYLDENGDVRDGAIRPLEHLFAHAFKEGRYVSKGHREAVRSRYGRYIDESLRGAEAERAYTTYAMRRAGAPAGDETPVTLAALRASQLTVLTVDFWDTLVIRTSPHWSAKLSTAKELHFALSSKRSEAERRLAVERGEAVRTSNAYQLQNRAAPAQMDGVTPSPGDLYRQRIEIEAGLFAEGVEYDFRSVMLRQIKRHAPFDASHDAAPEVEQLIEKLLLAEQDFESRHVTLNPGLLALLEQKLRSGTRVGVVSDFYHDSSFLRRILQNLGVDEATLARLDIFSSCEQGASKLAKGTLFDLVADLLGLSDRSEWVHIGDSEQSDVRAALGKGITAIHFRSTEGSKLFKVPEPSSVSAEEYNRAAFSAFETSARHAAVRPVKLPRSARHVEIAKPLITQAAQEFAMLPVLLVLAALEEAAARGLSQVLYLSREGIFLERVHAAIRPTLDRELRSISGVHLKTSRRSLFAPTFAANEAGAIAIFKSQYPNANVKTLLGALLPTEVIACLDPQELARLSTVTVGQLAACRNAEERISIPTLEICRKYAQQQLALLSRYLDGRGVATAERGDLLFCDIGWRGTMQDMLAEIFPQTNSVGVYFGLFPFHLPQKHRAMKIGLAFDGNAAEAFAHVDPPAAIERTWTPNVGSAIGYIGSLSGEVSARMDDSDCTELAEMNIGAFQDEVVRVAPIVAAEYVRYGLNRQAVRLGLSERVKGYFAEPHPGISELWFSSLHDDTFGSGENPYKKQLPPMNEVSNTNLRYLVETYATRSRWKDGYRNWPAVQWLDTLLGEQK